MFEVCLSLQASDGGINDAQTHYRDRKHIYNVISDHGEFDVEGVGMLYRWCTRRANTVLIRVIRYNKLIGVMLTLPDVLKAMKGLVVMSTELESIANACYQHST